MSASGFLKQGDLTNFHHYVADANGNAAARLIALTGTRAVTTGGPGQVWISAVGGDVYVIFGDSDADATGLVTATDEWFVPNGTNPILNTRGQTHVSVKASASIGVHITEVYA